MSTTALALTGLVGPALFVAVFMVLGVVKPGYDPKTRFVSEGSIGRLGLIQIANFMVLGVMLMCFAVALWNRYGNQASGRLGAALMIAVGVGLFLAGVFVTDPGTRIVTRHGLIHVVASMVVFGGLMLACFAFAWRLHTDIGFAVYSVATGIFIPIGIVVTNGGGRLTGVSQRILIIVAWTWIAVLAWRVTMT